MTNNNIIKIHSFQHLFPELTERQFRILEMYALGKTQKNIYHSLRCSKTAIDKHFVNLKVIFECETTSDLRGIYLNRFLRTIAIYSNMQQH